MACTSEHARVGSADNGTPHVEALRLRIVSELEINWRSWTRAIRHICLALVDQGLFSSVNFIVSILLARWLGPSEYGSYALAFSIYVLISLAYQALIAEPMGVFGPSDYGDRLREYVGAMLRIHVPLSLLIGGALVASSVIGYAVGAPVHMQRTLLALAFGGPNLLFLYLARRAFYLELAPGPPVIGSVLYCVLVLVGLAAATRTQIVSASIAFLLMGGAALVAGGLILLHFRPTLRGKHFKLRVAEVFAKHWHYGKWAFASAICSWVPLNIFYTVVSQGYGIAEAGRLRALTNFMLPAAQGHVAISMLALPYASSLLKQNRSELPGAVASVIALLYGAGTAVYWVVIIVSRAWVVPLLYAGKYTSIIGLLPWLAVGSVLSGVSFGPITALRANNAPKTVFWTYGSGAVVTFISVPAVWMYGVTGALFAFVLANLVVVCLGFLLLHRHTRSTAATTASTESTEYSTL